MSEYLYAIFSLIIHLITCAPCLAFSLVHIDLRICHHLDDVLFHVHGELHFHLFHLRNPEWVDYHKHFTNQLEDNMYHSLKSRLLSKFLLLPCN